MVLPSRASRTFYGRASIRKCFGESSVLRLFVCISGNDDWWKQKKGKLYYPKLGKNVVLYANATILGETTIGNNVIVSSNTYIINEKVPDNCIVFGQSPNIVIKEKSEPEILEMTKHIWRW